MQSLCSLLVLLALPGTLSHGAGVWTDPAHADSAGRSLAGTRIVAESPPHHLTLVGTDDGVEWYALTGRCSGSGMTQITFDFSSKGGPAALTGTWARQAGKTTIAWPDGNTWTMLERPTAAWLQPTPIDDHVGLFTDPASWTDRSSFAGTRYFAEWPPHQLTVVGMDEAPDPEFGKALWVLRGNCSGYEMTKIFLDGLGLGRWTSAEKRLPLNLPGSIQWADGTTWSQLGEGGVLLVTEPDALRAESSTAARSKQRTAATPHDKTWALLAVSIIGVVYLVAMRRPAGHGSGVDGSNYEK